MSKYIDEFIAELIKSVRDRAIRDCDMCLKPEAGGVRDKRWKQALSENPRSFINMAIADCVDLTIANLLLSIDHGLLNLSFQSSDGTLTNLEHEGLGEMTGNYLGGDWRAEYSKERFIDDTEDLKDFFLEGNPERLRIQALIEAYKKIPK